MLLLQEPKWQMKLKYRKKRKKKPWGKISLRRVLSVREDSVGKRAWRRTEREPQVTRKELLGVTQEWPTVDKCTKSDLERVCRSFPSVGVMCTRSFTWNPKPPQTQQALEPRPEGSPLAVKGTSASLRRYLLPVLPGGCATSPDSASPPLDPQDRQQPADSPSAPLRTARRAGEGYRAVTKTPRTCLCSRSARTAACTHSSGPGSVYTAHVTTQVNSLPA